MTLAESAAKAHARFTVEQFHRLCAAVPEQRLELIEGEVLQVIAKGTQHTAVVHRLIAALQALLADPAGPGQRWQLRVEAPLDLGPGNEPEPDLALVARRADDYWQAHPSAADTWLVIEVADSSLAFDLNTKAKLYATAGIPHYWVVDVQRPRLHRLMERPCSDPDLSPVVEAVEQVIVGLPTS
ncbi:MAG: Uma2 family endonuclease [Synechococcaceae cyanobacterium]